MPRCIFCLNEYPGLTDEHIFPAALGGRLKIPTEQGWELVEEGSVEEEVQGSLAGDLEFIGSSTSLRAAAKIAYTGLALSAGEIVISDIFDEIRLYVRTEGGKPAARLFFNEDLVSAVAQGPHQHSIVIAARRNENRVDAIVRLFGWLSYFVILSERYEGADFSNTLVYDAQRGERNEILYTHLEAEFSQIEQVAKSTGTVWDDVTVAGERFIYFLNQAIQAKLK